MEEIVIPNLDDDDDDDDFQLPNFSRGGFGNASSASLNEYEGSTHRHHPSSDTIPRFGGPSTTPIRPTQSRGPASHTTVPSQGSYGYDQEVLTNTSSSTNRSRVGQFSNGSASSLVTPGTSISSNSGILGNRKGSLASFKNPFKSNGSSGQTGYVPPVPSIDPGGHSAPGYPTLRNPFSRLEAPASPGAVMLGQSPRTGRQNNLGSPGPSGSYNRQPSVAHSSHRSQGGRSATSQGSSNFRAEDHPMPSLPPIPTRSTPSRLGRLGSGSGSSLHLGTGGYRRQGSLGGDEILEGKTPGEEALRVVFKEFKGVADAKIARICGRPLPSLPAYLESSSDTQLDTLIGSLAHCSRRHPRRVVDLLQNWCRAHCDGIGASEVRTHLDRSHGLQMRVEDAAAILGGRKSSAAKYILNRTLIELVRVTPKEIMGEELGMTLEGNAFGAYRNDKGDEMSPHKKAVALLQVELLGELSKTRFLTISDRFIREMSKYAALPSSKETDIRMEHLLRGMRYLKIRVYPEDELEMSSEFIQSLASLYANPHVSSQGLKNAYADTLVHLLHPVIETATAEVNHPMWSKAIALILQKALAAASKPKYWAASFPLVVVALGVSPRDVFMQQWQACMDAIIPKLRDRSQRIIALNSFNRLLWIYLNRCAESVTSTRKRLDQLTKVFFSTNGSLFPGDLHPDVFTWMLHYIITRQLDYGEEFLKDFLRGMDGSVSDPLLATRAACLVRAISATLLAVEEERHAAWPSSAEFHRLSEENPATSGDPLPEEVGRKDEIPELLARCGPAVAGLIFNCDRAAGTILLSSDSVTVTGTASSSAIDNAEVITRKHGDVHASYATRHEPVMRLLTAVFESIPRTLASDVVFPPIANALCRGTFSADPRVCETAAAAMRRVVLDPTRCLFLVNTYREFIFETRHIFRDTFIGSRLIESQFERVVGIWLDLLTQLVQHQRYAASQPDEAGAVPRPPTIGPTAMTKIEGCGLFLLCSTSLPLRKLAGQILTAARDLEGTQPRPSAAFRYSRFIPDQAALTRVIQLYDAVPEESDIAAMRRLPWLSSADRNRFDIIAQEKGKTLQRLAESEQGKDTTLWLSILPYFITRVSEVLASPVQELRSILIPIAIRLQVHVASVANVGSARAASTTMKGGGGVTHRSSSDVAILADHWRTYLSILSVTMPSPTNQPATPSIPRTKDVIILTPDTISTPVLFHYLTSLLAWEDTRYRDAAVYAMGCVGQPHLRPLSDILLGVVRRLADTKKTPSQNSLWTAVAHVFRLISPLILDIKSSSHSTNLASMVSFVRVTYNMLADKSTREDYDLQSLRRSFCVVVENLTAALGKLDSSDRFFGEELRGAIFKLCYDWCHVGRRPDVAKARESHTLQTASDSYKGERDRAQYLDDLQAKTKLLSAAAAEAMAGLCQGSLVTSTDSTPATQASSHIVDPLIVLRWIRGMFTSTSTNHHETARKALHSLIKYNWECSRLLDEVLHQSFGEGEQFNLDSSFFGVVAEILVEQTLDIPVEQLCCLALSKLGHPVPDIRLRAFQLVGFLLPDAEMRVGIASMLPAIGSSAPSIYRAAQREISERLASIYADHALSFLAESVGRLSQLEAPRRSATLSVLPAWMAYIELSLDTSDLTPEQAEAEQHALANIMYLAIRFLNDHLPEVCDVLASFASAEDTANTTVLVKYLFEQGARRRSAEFVLYAQRVLACLSLGVAGEEIFIDICDFVQPDYMALASDPETTPSPQSSLADLDAILSVPLGKGQTFSTGQLALLFAGELLPHRLNDPSLSSHLPTLLHVAITHCDSPVTMIREQSQSILFQILRVWICDLSGVVSNNGTTWAVAEHKLTLLAGGTGRGAGWWRIEDVGGADTAFFAPPAMTTMIMKILGVLLPLQPRIRQVWGELALTWATSCPIRHLACRSFQIFRTLSPKVNASMISDILARLSSTIGSSSLEIQTFNLEVLRTFASITQGLESRDMAAHPQLFWCAMACLTSPYEEEWMEVTELLSHILDKTNLSDPAVVENLVKYRPVDWVGPPPHLQALLLVGLRSTKTVFMAFDLIRRLSSVVGGGELIDSSSDRLINGFVAALPWMLHSTDLGEPNEDLGMMAMDLASLADTQSLPSFSRLLTSFARGRFRSKDDFIRQACSLLREYMVSHAIQIITLLLGFILNDTSWMREKSLSILQLILLSPESRLPLVEHGTELLQPLLRLVSTPHAAQALEILDMPVVAAAQAEALSGSMMASGNIFGSISESGWSVPNVKESSGITRENVKAVFGTCGEITKKASAHYSVVQFKDIRKFRFGAEGGVENEDGEGIGEEIPRFPSDLGSGDQMIGGNVLEGEEGELGMSGDNASMGDLVNALHSLGQFFGEEAGEEMDGGGIGDSPRSVLGGGGLRGYGRSHMANMPSDDLSGRRVRAIMARAGSNQSISSTPIYEPPTSSSQQSTYPYRSHKPTHSEAYTDSSLASSTDNTNRTPLNSIPARQGQGQFAPAFSFGGVRPPHSHSTNPSFSDMSDMGEQDPEQLFGLESAGFEAREVDADEDGDLGGLGMSEQSTPVLVRSNKRFGGGREDAGTPSPSIRRN